MLRNKIKIINKNKKGYILSDVFIAFTVSVLFASAITASLFVSNNLTKDQMTKTEVSNIAGNLIAEIQASDSYEFRKGLIKAYNQKNPGNKITDENQKIELPMDEPIPGQFYKYNVVISIQPDSLDPNFEIIDVIVKWTPEDGIERTTEFKSFKVAEM